MSAPAPDPIPDLVIPCPLCGEPMTASASLDDSVDIDCNQCRVYWDGCSLKGKRW